MRFSVGLPTCMEGMMYPVPFATSAQIVEIAQYADKLGYHSVWGNDHMTTQRYVRAEFPTPPNFWEILITLTYVAAQTTTLRVATGVLVPAMRRDIVVMAKQLATLDQFSGGRLMVGMGVGAYREEFEALQPGWKVQRGDVLEECVQALQVLFSQRIADWQGTYYAFKDVEMYPKPVQTPLPFYIGGNNANSIRRAALYGQGWMGAGMPPDQLFVHVKRLREIAAENGRDPDTIDIAPQMAACIDKNQEAAHQRFQNSQMYAHLVSLKATTLKDQAKSGAKFEDINLIGDGQTIIERVGKLRDAGASHISGILFTANTVEEFKDQMQYFAEEVIRYFEN
ncbi:MAG: TIGR03619 family F420-dependent LLM class oxidoreductase [Anaerolineaceae bacterium]|nr:TIGR03619 family F420-dependent LLM class oxidoreductase [Anaerolineaceae bacterium]